MEAQHGMHASSTRSPHRALRTRARFSVLLSSGAILVGTGGCAPHYVPFATDSIAILGAVAAPGDGLEVGLGVGATWIELDVRNLGASSVWVSIDGITVTGPDGREHGMVESAVLNAVESELAAARYSSRAPQAHLASMLAADWSPSLGQPRAVGDRTASIEPGKRVQLLLHPIEYVRLDGTGISPFPAPFWGGLNRDEGGELRVSLPVSWGRTWGHVEIVGRLAASRLSGT